MKRRRKSCSAKRAVEVKTVVADKAAYSTALFPLAIESKSFDEASGEFSGYLSTWSEDKVKDIIEPGAFKKTLNDAYQSKEARQDTNFVLPLLWQHKPDEPVGGFLEMREDAHGLFVKGWIDVATELGRRAWNGLKRGYLGGLSIGYQVIKANTDSKGIRHITELALVEGSVVTFPANPEATVPTDSVKSDNPTDLEEKAGRVLSAPNFKALSASVAAIQTELNKLQAILDANSPDNQQQQASQPQKQSTGEAEHEPSNDTQVKNDGEQDTENTEALEDLLEQMKLELLIRSIRM